MIAGPSASAFSLATLGRLRCAILATTAMAHLAMVQWLGAAGVEIEGVEIEGVEIEGVAIEHVPCRAPGAVMTEVLAGRLDLGSIALGSAARRADPHRTPGWRARAPRVKSLTGGAAAR